MRARTARLGPVAATLLLGVAAGCTSDGDAGDPDGLGTPSPAPQPTTLVGRPTDGHDGTGPHVVRTVVAAPNGRLRVTTSNRDGRGDPRPGDDRILEVSPSR